MTEERGIWANREKAIEAGYFRQQDRKLIEKLREGAKFDDVAQAIRDKLQVDKPELLARVRALGINADNAAAFLLAPLVHVAWAGGSVSRQEREVVLRHGRERGIEDGSPAQKQVLQWLEVQPEDALLETSLEVVDHTLSVLPRAEREERIQRLMDACHDVAKASGSKISWVLGLFDGINSSEASALDSISKALRKRP